MKKKQVELTQEQCQEIIDQMTTRSFYRSDKGNSSGYGEFADNGIVGIVPLTTFCQSLYRQ